MWLSLTQSKLRASTLDISGNLHAWEPSQGRMEGGGEEPAPSIQFRC